MKNEQANQFERPSSWPRRKAADERWGQTASENSASSVGKDFEEYAEKWDQETAIIWRQYMVKKGYSGTWKGGARPQTGAGQKRDVSRPSGTGLGTAGAQPTKAAGPKPRPVPEKGTGKGQ